MKLPDGPRTPLWLETIQFILRPVEYLEARRDRYGDAFTIGDRNHSPVVYLSNPQAIKEIFTADPNLFESGRGNKQLVQPFLGEYSLALIDGEPHQRQRRLLMPPFHGERMRVYGQLICDITQQVIDKWTPNRVRPFHPAMQEITLRVILQAIFGVDRGQHLEELIHLVSEFANSIGSPLSASLLFFPVLQKDLGNWSPWGRFLHLREQMDRMIYSEIQQRRQSLNENRNDILTLLLMARDEDGQPMTDGELRDQLVTLLVAGHETTASVLTWALYWILYLPEVLNKLLSEINTIDPDADSLEIARLPYLTALCQETLRIYPVVMNTANRFVKAPVQIMDYQFDPGTVLTPCIYLTHHREDLYPEPKRFKPERFLERQFAPYEYLPFGGGNRSCIGMAFAQFEIKLVLATILSRLQLTLEEHRLVNPVRRGLTISPPSDLGIIVKGHRQPQKVLARL